MDGGKTRKSNIRQRKDPSAYSSRSMVRAPACSSAESRQYRGRSGALSEVSGNGGRSERITAKTARRGNTSLMTMLARAPAVGVRTGWRAPVTIMESFALHWPYGNGNDPILKERLFGLTNNALWKMRRPQLRIRIGLTISCSTSISMATTGPGSVLVTRRVGPGSLHS
jgi:hypothetical protein